VADVAHWKTNPGRALASSGIEKAPEIKVNASASIGLDQWQTGESMKDVIEHADKDMYVNKEQTRKEKR